MIEFTGFNIIAVVMGRISGIYAAAHNIICTLTSVAFMIPLAISNAIAIKVGYANGAKDYDDLKKYAYKGIFVCVGVMAVSAVILLSCPKFIVGLFTKDAELIAICVPIIYLLSGFQIFDGLQVALSGICKGIKSTKIVLIANCIAYWFISIPFGWILAFRFNLGLIGFWIGLIVAAVCLCSIMIYLLKRYFKNLKNQLI